jgi:hypothetical protein
VGKGLNIKGKSAKRGRQQGLVPFLQISYEEHKDQVAGSPPEARSRIFFNSEDVRERMLREFEPLLDPDNGLHITGDRVIFYIDQYPGTYGLDLPEVILRHVFIDEANISFRAGWETGRSSEPAFMEMNFVSLRGTSEPRVVLIQADLDDPKNPHGLLMAYAEETVKPVVSDFDTFLVGSRNMHYKEMPREQVEIAYWALKHTHKILQSPANRSWTSRWLDVIKQAKNEGFCAKTPPLGFGDDTACRLIKEVMDATHESGAVRHGAECFNYYFPQELDNEYLIVWDGFQNGEGFHEGEKPWEYADEDDLRDFLFNRIQEGFLFPLNPIWIVRDVGWYELYEEIKDTENGADFLNKVFLDDVGIKEKIEQIHTEFPEGFMVEVSLGGHRKSALLDMDKFERADLAMTGLEQANLDSHLVTMAGPLGSMQLRRASKFDGMMRAPSKRDGKRATMTMSRGIHEDDDIFSECSVSLECGNWPTRSVPASAERSRRVSYCPTVKSTRGCT